jgi:hypothetical protein
MKAKDTKMPLTSAVAVRTDGACSLTHSSQLQTFFLSANESFESFVID